MKKITVGLFNDSFMPMTDGVGVVVDNYARRLSKKCNVIVFVPKYKNYDDANLPYKVVRCRSVKLPFVDYSFPLPFFDYRFRKEVKKASLDVVHIHSPFSLGKYGVKIGKKRNIPVFGTMHSQYRKDFFRATKMKWLSQILTNHIMKVFDQCSQCFTVNSGMAHLYYEEYGARKMPGVLSNATEMEYASSKKDANHRIDSLWNLSPRDKVLLFVGRINRLKNIFFLVDSLEILSQKKPPFSYKMLFVGDGQDFGELREYIQKKHLEDSILLCGKVEDRTLLRDYYVRSDLFLFPSLYDASSIVQIEAASQKVPGIFLRGSMTGSDVQNRVNGFLVDNEEEFADCILEVLSDSKLYQTVSDGAYRFLYKKWDDIVENVLDMYLEYIEER